MNLEQTIFENTDVAAATGLSAATIQTWANRGILMLSKKQRNPGPGQKRLYSALDIARVAATQSLIGYGLTASTASQIAFRLERGQSATRWREALQKGVNHIYIFVVDDFDIGAVYTGNEPAKVAEILNALSEDCEGGPVAGTTKIQTKTAVFDIGSGVCSALRLAISWHQVLIKNNDVAEMNSRGLMHDFVKAFQAAGCPNEAEVFHGRNDTRDHIYYFSPAASAIAAKALRQFSAAACAQPQNVAGLRKVKL